MLPKMSQIQKLLNAKSTLPKFCSLKVKVLNELLGAKILKISINS